MRSAAIVLLALLQSPEIVRTGDPAKRGLSESDFRRILPQEKILFMSEAYLNRIFPAMRSAYPSEWVEMIARAQAMDVEIYVPGHGFVESPALLEEELETFRRASRRRGEEA